MSKWRRYQARARVEVFRDYLAERGVWPFVRAKWRPDRSSELSAFMREHYGSGLDWLVPTGETLFGSAITYAGTPIGPPTNQGLLDSILREINRPPARNDAIFVSPRQLAAYRRMLMPTEPPTQLVVSRVDTFDKSITISTPEEPRPTTGRRPTFIPVRRLDGRRR